jgi:DNA modification methylase
MAESDGAHLALQAEVPPKKTKPRATQLVTEQPPPVAPSAGDGPTTHISDLVPDPKNARKHTPRNVGTIVDALNEVGAARSIVIDEDNVVLAGNATIEAAGEAGLTKVQVVEADGNTIIAVRRRGLTPEQKARLAIFDNRAAELADGWDTEVLKALAADGVDLSTFWNEDELAALYEADAKPNGGLTDPDSVPAKQHTEIQLGDLFELGPHRLLCGDSTSAEAVDRLLAGAKPLLMVTDPPYGVEYDPEWRTRAGVNKSDRMGKVMNDDRADWTEVWKLFPGDVAYVWHASVACSEVQDSLTKAAFGVRSQIIWRKPRIVLSRGHYHWQHETCFYAVKDNRTGHWGGKRNQSTVWPIVPTVHTCQTCGSTEVDALPEGMDSTVWDIETRDKTGDTIHSTQKPVECMARPMRNHAILEVFEPFSGSGSTIIAGEMTSRKVFAIELDPTYVQVAIDRWEAFTGKKAKKIDA